jgi:hypothetical protein
MKESKENTAWAMEKCCCTAQPSGEFDGGTQMLLMIQ